MSQEARAGPRGGTGSGGCGGEGRPRAAGPQVRRGHVGEAHDDIANWVNQSLTLA